MLLAKKHPLQCGTLSSEMYKRKTDFPRTRDNHDTDNSTDNVRVTFREISVSVSQKKKNIKKHARKQSYILRNMNYKTVNQTNYPQCIPTMR